MKPLNRLVKNKSAAYFLKYFGLFMLLFVSLAMAALLFLVMEQRNPFLYAQF